MPSSDAGNIGLILDIVRKMQPAAILDVGIGCGKYGMLFREYLDGHWTKRAFHDKSTWQTVLIGIEVFKKYITPVHEYLYNEIIIDDAFNYILRNNPHNHFDLVFMGDILEHFPKEKGKVLIQLLRDFWVKRGGSILISTPNVKTCINDERLAIFGNSNEVHRCRWYAADFAQFNMKTKIVEDRTLTVVLEKR